MKLTMYISLADGSRLSWEAVNGELWERVVDTDHAPTPGVDRVILWPAEDPDDGPLGGPMWDAYERYMDAVGGWHLELARMVIDPSEKAQDSMMRAAAGGPPYRDRSWWTRNDGDPRGALRRGGWRPYS